MKTHTTLACSLLFVGWMAAGCERPAPTGTTPNQTTPSTGMQNRTPTGSATNADGPTAIDQSNSPADIKVTADVRRAIMEDDSMSTSAKNCTIVTDGSGTVTLRGTVASQAERDSIEGKARAAAGDRRIVNELRVATP